MADEKGKGFDILTLLLWVVAVLSVLALYVTVLQVDGQLTRQEEPAPIVLAFLDEYVATKAIYDQELVIEKYLSSVDRSTFDHDGQSADLRNFNAVFLPSSNNYSGYRVCYSVTDYLEIMLVDEAGKDLPCRIGLCYRVGADGKLASYSVFRLQPVSRADSEWNGEWM